MPTAAIQRAGAALAVATGLLLAACKGGGSGPQEGEPALVVSASSLSFSATAGGASPAPQAFTVTNGGGGTLALPATAIAYGNGTGWLRASVSGTSAPFIVSIQPDVAALSPGTYAATVSVESAGASSSPRAVAVSLTVSATGSEPVIALSPSSLSFLAAAGGAAPPDQSVVVSNAGSGTLSRPTVAVAYGGGPAWLSVPVTGTAAPYTIDVHAASSSLAVGTYAATVTIDCPGASNTPVTLSVGLIVSSSTAPPAISLSTTALSLSGTSFGPAPAARTVTIANGGGGVLAPPTASIQHHQGAGWLEAEVTGTSAPYILELRPVAASLSAGTYAATVQLASAGASNTPRSISVTLTLSPSWTVFVYAHADSDAGTSFVRALQEMNQAVLGDAVRLVVAADYSAGRPLPTGGSFPSGTEWYRILGAGQGAVLLGARAEEDFDDPAVLGASVADAFAGFPADHYAVILWGHGASWRGFGGDEQDTPDDPSDDGAGMTPAGVAGALSGALAATGLTGRLDLVGFDASLMMGNELAYELRDVATVLVGGAEVDLGGGWDYARSLSRLGAEPSLSAVELALGEVEDWDARHASASAVGVLARAHAALQLAQLDSYAAAWRSVADAILQSGTIDWLELARRQLRTGPGYGLDDPGDPAPQPALRDAGQLLDALAALSSDGTVASAAEVARGALDTVVLATSLGDLRAGEGQAGLHVEAALATAWPARADAYTLLGWSADTGWGDVLGSIAGHDDLVAPTVDTLALDNTNPTRLNPPRIRIGSPDGDVAAARVYIAQSVGGQVLSHGLLPQPPGVTLEPDLPVNKDEQHELIWDGNLHALSDGVHQSRVLVEPWIRGSSSAVFLLPGVIRDGAAAVEAYALLVDGSPSVGSFAVGVNGALTVLPMSDFGGLEFVPSLFDETAGSWVPATPLDIPSDPAASFTFGRSSAPAGTYRIVTRMTDVWGNVGVESDTVTVVTPFGT